MVDNQQNCFDPEKLGQELHNNTEKIVLKTMQDLLTDADSNSICTCQQCLKDIAAYALNRLPAKYIASAKDDFQTKLIEFENEVNLDTVSVVKKAINVVAQNPRH